MRSIALLIYRIAWFTGMGVLYFSLIIVIAQWSEARYLFWLLFSIVISRLLKDSA